MEDYFLQGETLIFSADKVFPFRESRFHTFLHVVCLWLSTQYQKQLNIFSIKSEANASKYLGNL